MPPVAPMLAKLTRELPVGDYLYEPKWDGFRCIVFRDGSDVELGSRNERPLTRYFPDIVAAVIAELPDRCVIDGEIVIAGTHGVGFRRAPAADPSGCVAVNMLAERTPASFVAFDLLALGDLGPSRHRLRGRRRDALAGALQRSASSRASHAGDHRHGHGH